MALFLRMSPYKTHIWALQGAGFLSLPPEPRIWICKLAYDEHDPTSVWERGLACHAKLK